MSKNYLPTWASGGISDGSDNISKYVDQFDGAGKRPTDHQNQRYALKDGYESRYLGAGDNISSNGALATYTNDYDDMWDSYDPLRDKQNYGIFKKAVPETVEKIVYKDKPAPKAAPKPAPKPVPIQLSKTVAKAIGRAEAYKEIKDGDDIIGNDPTVIADFNKQTKENTKEALKPYFQRDVDPIYAQSYADRYKLDLGDDFKLTKLV